MCRERLSVNGWKRWLHLISWLGVFAYVLAFLHTSNALEVCLQTITGIAAEDMTTTDAAHASTVPAKATASGSDSRSLSQLVDSSPKKPFSSVTLWRKIILRFAAVLRIHFPELFPPPTGHDDCILCRVAKMPLMNLSLGTGTPLIMPFDFVYLDNHCLFVPAYSGKLFRPPRSPA